MAKPSRNSDPGNVLSPARTFFVTTKTSMGRNLLQSERNAMLIVDVLRSYQADGKFEVHDFVVMPNHVHLLISVPGDSTIERVMQLIKGGFSYRLRHEFAYTGEVWQRGFSETRVVDQKSYRQYKKYIAENPVKAGLAKSGEEFAFCFARLAAAKAQRLKPVQQQAPVGTAEAVP